MLNTFLYICLLLLSNYNSRGEENRQVCKGTFNGVLGSKNNTSAYENLKRMYKGCQYVQTNLEITALWDLDPTMTFDFLKDIREVFGYVLIALVAAQRIPLDNLRIIRGNELFAYYGDDPINSLYIESNLSGQTIFMPKLTEISNGNIEILDINHLCFLKDINWSDIINDDDPSRINLLTINSSRSQCESCHKSCGPSSKRGCWGNKKSLCQNLTRTGCDPSCENRCSINDVNMCCDSECSAGCFSESNSGCFACKNIIHEGKCMNECPRPNIYDAKLMKYVDNPNGLYRKGDSCVKKCPKSMFLHEDSCLSECGIGYKIDYDRGECVRCTTDCPITCHGPSGMIISLNADNLKKLVNCSVFYGTLYINRHSFQSTSPITVEDLKVLETIEIVTNYVHIGTTPPELENLHFLRNLKTIQGQELSESGTAMYISETNLKELGLNSLKSIPAGNITIIHNPNLCYVNTVAWSNITAGHEQIIYLRNNSNSTECESKGFVCNQSCDPLTGCMGPGRDQCLSCIGFTYANLCLSSCAEFDEFIPLYAVNANTCRSCHDQCIDGCDGPLNSQCWACANFKWNSTCLAECPVEMSHNSKKECISQRHVALIAALSALAGLILISGLVFAIMCYKKDISKSEEEKLRLAAKLSGVMECEPVNPTSVSPNMAKLRLIKESELRKGGIIGSGAFGTVYKGLWLPQGENLKIPVAIKVLQNEGEEETGRIPTGGEHEKEILEEAQIMASVVHPFCMHILAVCMGQRMMLVSQFMPHGCLLDYVRNNINKIGSKYMLNWCSQIAKGMVYLEEKKIIHRDLAARNVLVQMPNHVRITDFGLAKLVPDKDVYLSEGGKLPIKWLALECIREKIFTHKSDVWSFGVTIWEVFTHGERPYDNVPITDLVSQLEKGERLPQPSICTIDIYMVMIRCWLVDSDARPPFKELAEIFTHMAHDPGRFLVIESDELKRIPNETMDMRMLLLSISVESAEGDMKLMTAEEYLFMKNQQKNVTDQPDGVVVEIPDQNGNKSIFSKKNKNRPKITINTENVIEQDSSSSSSEPSIIPSPIFSPSRYTPDPTSPDKEKLISSLRNKPADGDMPNSNYRTSNENYLLPRPTVQPPYLEVINESDRNSDLDLNNESHQSRPLLSSGNYTEELNDLNMPFLASIVQNPEYFGDQV